jgi:thiamine-monophosphate kinase
VSDEDLAVIAAGQREAAEAMGAAVIGGNLARGGELSITTTALGEAARPLSRAGARPGDGLWIAGPIGLAAAGLGWLLRGGAIEGEAAIAAVGAWRRPRAFIEAGLAAGPIATAAIDVSDGLAQDVGHLARASSVRAILDEGALVSAELAAAAAGIGRDPRELALHGGEDYALVVALPAGAAIAGFRCIGRCEAGEAEVLLAGADGSLRPVEGRGFDHFRP